MADVSWLGDYAEQFLKSPSWTVPLTEFIDSNCVLFSDLEEEHQFSQTECHQKFCDLIDNLFCAHLLQVDVSPEDFAKYAGSQLDGNSHAKKLLLDELSSISDFLVFKKMMVARNKSLDAQAAPREPMQEIGNAVGADAAAASGTAKVGGLEGRDAVLRSRQKEREEQLRKWLEDPEPKKTTAAPAMKKMSAAEMRAVMATGTNHRAGGGKSYVTSLQAALN
jgi:hypothetical protein